MALNRGNLDPLHMRELYGNWPTVKPYNGPIPERFVSWSNRKRARPEDGIHFFTDDDRFEPVWKRPDEARRWVEGRVITGPDFSVWNEMPIAMVMWQHYRGAWLSRALEERGAMVIPSRTWRDGAWTASSMGDCPTVSISAYGSKKAGDAFRRGYATMVEMSDPERVLVIGGVMPDWLAADPRVTYRKAGSIADGR